MVSNIDNLLSASFIIKEKRLYWLNEIDICVTFTERQNIPLTDCLKEILLRNDIALTYPNIERIKLYLVQFYKLGGEDISLTKTSAIFLNREDKKFLPIVDDSYRSHMFIRHIVWKQFHESGIK